MHVDTHELGNRLVFSWSLLVVTKHVSRFTVWLSSTYSARELFVLSSQPSATEVFCVLHGTRTIIVSLLEHAPFLPMDGRSLWATGCYPVVSMGFHRTLRKRLKEHK